MDTQKPDSSDDAAIKARVVAWHNRHLLTCRIDAAQVTGIGVVELPFALPVRTSSEPSSDQAKGPGGRLATLRNWLHRRRRLRTKPWFNDNFVPPLAPRVVGQFARRFGESVRPGDPDWPLRTIQPSDPHTAHQSRYLRTAAIESGGRRLRVLIGNGSDPAIIGPRVWDRKRLSGVVGFVSLLVILGSLSSIYRSSAAGFDDGMHLSSASADRAPVAASPALAAVPIGPPASSSERDPPQADRPASGAFSESPPLVPAPSSSAEAPPVEAAASAAVGPVDRSAQSDRVSPIATDMAPAQLPPKAAAGLAPAASAAAAADFQALSSTPQFALAAEPTRSRVSSALRLSLLGFPVEPQKDGVHAELMQAGPLWRVVIWPYANQQAAEQAQDVLRRRGVKVELITF